MRRAPPVPKRETEWAVFGGWAARTPAALLQGGVATGWLLQRFSIEAAHTSMSPNGDCPAPGARGLRRIGSHTLPREGVPALKRRQHPPGCGARPAHGRESFQALRWRAARDLASVTAVSDPRCMRSRWPNRVCRGAIQLRFWHSLARILSDHPMAIQLRVGPAFGALTAESFDFACVRIAPESVRLARTDCHIGGRKRANAIPVVVDVKAFRLRSTVENYEVDGRRRRRGANHPDRQPQQHAPHVRLPWFCPALSGPCPHRVRRVAPRMVW